MGIRIIGIHAGSYAERAGLKAEDVILAINGENVIDEIDYQALTAGRHLDILLSGKDDTQFTVHIEKRDWEPLGVVLDESVILKPRQCRNHCIFCFIDQMPAGARSTLYVKDDDWRLSLMMGNYITLTNIDDNEFLRILKRKAGPLYISVHATDPETRIHMLRNPNAGNILERLRTLAAHGISFHCQIVLCPGINDGAILVQSIREIAGLYPYAQSLAVVPVGLTKYRDKLTPIRQYDPASALEVISMIEKEQIKFLEKYGTRFVFPSDEFYVIAGVPIPEKEYYENLPQIENGVGMFRNLEQEIEDSLKWDEYPEKVPAAHYVIGCGYAAEEFIRSMCVKYAPDNVTVDVIPVRNDYFGDSVSVTGLITGKDLITALSGITADRVYICDCMLRENSDVFLDDLTVADVSRSLGISVLPVRNNGESFLKALYGLEV